MAEPGGVTENRDHFEVFHVHFGFDAIAPEDLREVVDELKRHNKPRLHRPRSAQPWTHVRDSERRPTLL